MKTRDGIWLYTLIIAESLLIFANSCKKENGNVQPPVVATRNIYSLKPNRVNCRGFITSDGGATVTARGVCWSTFQNPTTDNHSTTDGTGAGSFKSLITGLTATTTYYVRAYATNSAGTQYGNEIEFKTYTDTLVDIDGNVYNTMTIGAQTWMSENLKTTKYNDNTSMPLVSDINVWAALSTPGFCWYNNDAFTYQATRGALYNWFAVDAASNGGKNVCPIGWHVPSNAEWTTLTTFLGGESVAGAKMKQAGIDFWLTPNAGATNESGFTGLPGGGRYNSGLFSRIGRIGGWWTSTELEYLNTSAHGRYLYYNYSMIYSGSGNKLDGFSVRCVKDSGRQVKY